jgi:outer membrane receptor for ferrienterochelin and colicin
MGASTDFEGYYFILNVPSGIYNLKASLVGYTSLVQREIKIDPDRTTEINFQLSSTVIEVGEVTITAEKELVKADVSGTQEIINAERLEQLPVTRIDEFMGTLKGVEVVSGAQGHGLSIRGGAIRETDVRLDGISLQDPRTENSYLALNTTTVEEIQILTGGFQAKYGGIRSGLLNVVTKDGNRERYQVSLKTDFAPANQKRFFGSKPLGKRFLGVQSFFR